VAGREELKLVNLTGHPVALFPSNGSSGSAFTLTSNGPAARVSEVEISDRVEPSASGLVRIVELRQLGQVTTLPEPDGATRYVVSRLTAMAAPDRDDLLFPFDEVRNDEHTVVGARALASLEPLGRPFECPVELSPNSEKPRWWNRRPHFWSVFTSRLARSDSWLGLAFTLANVLLSASLGLVLGLTQHDSPLPWAVRLGAGMGLVGTFLLVLGFEGWTRRGQLRHEAGTAYVVDEQAETWTQEAKSSFGAKLREEFLTTLTVPGPGTMDLSWRWSLNALDAPRWDAYVDRLVHAFWSVHLVDREDTHNCVFVWAWWPVALSFGSRATYGRRGLSLRVGRRPSFGRQGSIYGTGSPVSGHLFSWPEHPEHSNAPAATESAVAAVTTTHPNELRKSIAFTVIGDDTQNQPSTDAESPWRIRVLLVRMTSTEFDQDTMTVGDYSGDETVAAAFRSTKDTGVEVPFAEFTMLPPDGHLHHAWETVPALARAATRWVAAQPVEEQTITLLGMLVPPEVAVGMGILAAAPAGGGVPEWPTHLWPLVWDGPQKHFVVPGLDIGRKTFNSTRAKP
jgi:hypothetical protein